jgi:plasmid stabilization system protein ParE
MARLIWSPAALLDVQRLYRFLLPKSPDAARRAIKAIREAVKVLAHQPGVGRPVDDLPPEYREWVIDFGDSGYLARYRLAGDEVVILAVRHQREAGF